MSEVWIRAYKQLNDTFLNNNERGFKNTRTYDNVKHWARACVPNEHTPCADYEGSVGTGVGYTAEAYRFLKARTVLFKKLPANTLKTAEVVEFRGVKIYVLDWVAFIKYNQANLSMYLTPSHFYRSRVLLHRIKPDIDKPFILNKENVLNDALFTVADIAAKSAGRRVRPEVDYAGLERPALLTDLYQAIDLSSHAAAAVAAKTHPEPKYYDATQA